MRLVRGLGAGCAALIGVAVLVGPMASAAWAPSGHPWKSRTAFTQFVFDGSTNETVNFAGTLATNIKVGGDPVTGFVYTLKASVHAVKGTGNTSGGKYRLSGHTIVTVLIPPGPPGHPVTFAPTFTVHPPSPCRAHHPPGPCFSPTTQSVPVSAFVDSTGAVTGVQAGSANN